MYIRTYIHTYIAILIKKYVTYTLYAMLTFKSALLTILKIYGFSSLFIAMRKICLISLTF